MSNNSALPVETPDAIVQELISGLPEGTEDDSFLPHRQRLIVPLLYVCKLWHAVTERQMYKVISVGKTNGSATDDITLTKRHHEEGFWIAKKLLDTLQAHPRLAAYVEALELAVIPGEDWGQRVRWTRMNTQIIQACRNVKHVDNLANYDLYPNPDLKNLTTVLKEKSLVSFSLTHDGILTIVCKSELSLYDILPSWPKLQSLHVDGFHLSEVPKGETIFCCPELHEITLLYCGLRRHHYDFLRSITNHVTKFYVSSGIAECRDREAFYRCLRTWSSTLTHLRIRFDFRERNHIEGMDYKLLWDVVSTMTELRELQIFAETSRFYNSSRTSELNLSFIGGLSKLERLCIAPRWDFRWPGIAAHETAIHLPALCHIVGCEGFYGFNWHIRIVCDERNIKLEKWNEIWRNSKIPGFVL